MDYSTLPDSDLVKLTVSGDRNNNGVGDGSEDISENQTGDAYGELVKRYTSLVWTAVTGIISDRFVAEDVAQEVFIDGFTGIRALREPEKFAPWIYGIAKRKALHTVTRRKTYVPIEEYAENMESEAPTPEEAVLSAERREQVRNALNALSPKNRDTAELFYIKNLSVADISKRTGLPVGTVKSRLYEARKKLKGELSEMMEERVHKTENAVPDFVTEVKERITELRAYYKAFGDESTEFSERYEAAEKFIRTHSDKSERDDALGLYYSSIWTKKLKSGDKMQQLTDESDTAIAAALRYRNDIMDTVCESGNYGKAIELANEALALETVKSSRYAPEILFWRGASYINQKNKKAAMADFAEGVRIAEPSNLYRALNKGAVESLELLEEYCDNGENDVKGFDATAETYVKHGNAVYFFNEPGSGQQSVLWEKHRMEFLGYYISRCRDMLFDTDMKAGDVVTDKDSAATLTTVGYDECVTVPAGRFEHCLKTVVKTDGDVYEVWYARDVGLVKTVFTDNVGVETYELSEYEIHGGDGYFPFAEGNRWCYTSPAIPEYMFYRLGYRIDWTNGTEANLTFTHTSGMKKNFEDNYTLDSDYYISECDRLCDDWKTEEAIESLKKAVRANTSEQSAVTALAGIDYLNRFLAAQNSGCRIMPSSFNASTLTKADGMIRYGENQISSFGPYRFGSRHAEDRIFGVKLRFLQDYIHRVWDDRWVAGFEETLTDYNTTTSYTVSDGGTVQTSVGTFENTLKLTSESTDTAMKDENYFSDNYTHMQAGKKEYWYVRGVGIIKFDFTWGDFKSSCELTAYSHPAADDSYFPVQLGNRWEYSEMNLTAEGYRAKRIIEVRAGIADRFMISDSQEFWYEGTEEEYEAAKTEGKLK